jgi:hypothetical protein
MIINPTQKPTIRNHLAKQNGVFRSNTELGHDSILFRQYN